jgi:serine/threonine protein kinase/tetratricopeptide (TPR) repeat protein
MTAMSESTPPTRSEIESGDQISSTGEFTQSSGEKLVGRYRIDKEIGRGGMGIVYRARDLDRGRDVALKTLKEIDPVRLSYLKSEFRSLADLSHDNLITLYELQFDGRYWCLIMELVDGISFNRHITGSSVTAAIAENGDWEKLRDAFTQLALGVNALHNAGYLHRDIKPSNVLVRPGGRVVLLDFGLAAPMDGGGIYRSVVANLVGTISYMSPEQATGGPITTASDWYSVGVMLYEVLTRHVPFESADAYKVLRSKAESAAPSPIQTTPFVPGDLNALCVDLLQRDPASRPSFDALLQRLGGASFPSRATKPRRERDGPFVGRDHELSQLDEAYRVSRNGRPAIAYVVGKSGAGKSTLVQFFLDKIRSDPEIVILRGRCYQHESVPFKALDSLLDSVTQYLRQASPFEVSSLLPRNISELARVFPVLRQVRAIGETISDIKVSGHESSDPQELRRRAARGLCELLARLGDRHKLVLFIDDLQWGDVDSASVLTEILMAPDPPVCLVIGCCREEDVATSEFFRYIRKPHIKAPESYDERAIVVTPLREGAIRDLVGQLLRSDQIDESLVRTVVNESAGLPFLVYEFVESVRTRSDRSAVGVSPTLEEALWQRIQQFPEESRRLMEIVAVSGHPIGRLEACEAGQITSDDRVILPALRAARLIRDTTTSGSDAIDTYHDHVRECIRARLPQDSQRNYHRRLAEVLQKSPKSDNEILAVHFDGAGMPQRAASCYRSAASGAAKALAFDHAARLYERALQLKSWSNRRRCVIGLRRGDALANAGRGAEAATEYLAAAPYAEPALGLELQRRAALQFLTSGHVDQGIKHLAPVLDSVGTRLARKPWSALLSLLLRRTQLRLRGLHFNERPEREIDSEQLKRIDIGWSVVIGLSVIDPIRGADFQTRSLLLALRAGEPFRVARALAVEAAHLASSGSPQRAISILDKADRMATQVSDQYARGIVEMARGCVAYFAEDWPSALSFSRRAEGVFRKDCTGVTWELDTASAFSLWSLAKMGELAELKRVCPALLKEAEERGDLYAITNLSTQIMALVWLAGGEADEAREKLQSVMENWSQNGYHVQHHDALLAFVLVELYSSNPVAAWQRVRREWMTFRWSLLSQIQDLRVEMLQMRAYCALAMAVVDNDPPAFRSVAAKDARRLRREKLPWTIAMADYIDGTLAAQKQERELAAKHLRSAVTGFDRIHAGLYAAATRRQLSKVLGNGEGAKMGLDADVWFNSQGVKDADRMTIVYAPGFAALLHEATTQKCAASIP